MKSENSDLGSFGDARPMLDADRHYYHNGQVRRGREAGHIVLKPEPPASPSSL